MDTAARAAGVSDVADPNADPSRDVELGYNGRPSYNASRASLPLSHQRSFSHTSGRLRSESNATRPSYSYGEEGASAPPPVDGGDGEANAEEDLEWGPAHPCYPHLNPHVPVQSPLYQSTRVVRIKRDWMVAGDLAPTFSALYPEILDPVLPEDRFRSLISHLNDALVKMFNPWAPRAWFDAGMGLLTGWIYDDLGLAAIDREVAQLERWIKQWNKEFGEPEGVTLISLRRTAYLCLDIQVPDPQLSIDVGDDNNQTESHLDRNKSRSTLFNANRPASVQSNATTASSMRRPKDDRKFADYPTVPAIPGKYLEEAQQNVEKYVQEQQRKEEGSKAHEGKPET